MLKLTKSPAVWLRIDGKLYVLTSRYGIPMYQETGVRVDLGTYESQGPALRPKGV